MWPAISTPAAPPNDSTSTSTPPTTGWAGSPSAPAVICTGSPTWWRSSSLLASWLTPDPGLATNPGRCRGDLGRPDAGPWAGGARCVAGPASPRHMREGSDSFVTRSPLGSAARPPSLFATHVGKKYAMAISGAIFMLFVFLHMLGNLKLYLGPGEMNAYARWLRDVGEPAVPYEALLDVLNAALVAALC